MEIKKSIQKKDRLYSIYRRMHAAKDGVIRCYICGKYVPWQEAELMHFIPRKFHILRFEEKNTKPGCFECNQIKGGNLERYGEKLQLEYGESVLEELEELKHELFFYKEQDLLDDILELKTKIDELRRDERSA